MNVMVSQEAGAPMIRGALENRKGFPAQQNFWIQNFCKHDEKSEAAPVQLLGIMRRTKHKQGMVHHSQFSGVECTGKPSPPGISMSEVNRKVEVYKSH